MADNKFASPFREMAERIERLLEGEFAGAMLLVKPDGKMVAVVLADPSQDPEQFLAVCAAKIEIETAEYRMNKQGPTGQFRQR